MKVMVTGGAGFIGSHIVDALCERGDEVVVLDSLDPDVWHFPPPYLNAQADYCFTDLRTLHSDDRFSDVEAVVHLAALGGVSRAAREPGNVISANAGGTAQLIEAAKGWPRLKKVILASSFSVYGSNYTYKCPSCDAVLTGSRKKEDLDQGRFEVICSCGTEAEIQPITEAATPNPLETYGASKYMQELCFRGFDLCSFTALRFSSVYGRRLRLDDGEATIIAKLAGWIRSGEKIKLFEDGRQYRDWVYVGDIVAAALRLLDGVDAPPIVNVCSGKPTTLIEVCKYISDAIGVPCSPEVVGGYRPGDMRHCLGHASTLERLIGRPPTLLQEGARLAFGNL